MMERNGSRSGYTEFRYGPTDRPKPRLPSISILGGPKFRTASQTMREEPIGRTKATQYWWNRPLHKPILRKERRDEAIANAANLLKPWEFNPWEKEAAVYFGLRFALVAEGLAFHDADAEAFDIVRLAFIRLGRGKERRPVWDEGQHWHTTAKENCHFCSTQLAPELIARGSIFCGATCAQKAKDLREYDPEVVSHPILNRAIHIIKADKVPPRECEACGTTFKPSLPDTRFCSPTCVGVHHMDHEHRGWRDCLTCGTTFRPTNKDGRFCSPDCLTAGRHLLVEPRPCMECGEVFQPKSPTAKFCSNTCRTREWARRDREAKKEEIIKTCDHCGESYVAKKKKAQRFCSKGCKAKADTAARTAASRAQPPRYPPKKCECEGCEEVFIPRAGNSRFCSRKCKDRQKGLERSRLRAA